MSTPAIHGPIDLVLLEFPTHRVRGAAAEALMDPVDRGVIRVYDVLVIRKDEEARSRAVRSVT